MRALAILLIAACGSSSTKEEPGEITLELTSPLAGTEMMGDPLITIAGTVSTTNPDYGQLELYVNGMKLDFDATGAFTTTIVPELGINHIAVDAIDGLSKPANKEVDVLWAPSYVPPIAGTTGFDVEGAIELRLGQRFFDSRLLGTTLDLATNPVVAHDLSSALELILWHVDLAGLIGGSLQLGSGSSMLNVTIPNAAPSQIIVDAKVIQTPTGALDLKIDLNGVFLEMDGTFQFNNRTLVIDGGIGADMHATARLTLGLAADGSVDVNVTNVTASIGPLDPQFTGPDGDELDAFITIGNNDFRLLIEQLIQSELIPTFTEKVPPLLETLLGATDQLLDNVSFDLNTGLGPPVTLMLDGKIGALDIKAGPTIGTAPGHVTVRQDIFIRTNGAPLHATTRGAPQLDAMPPKPNANTASVGLSLRTDFLNALLHSLWNQGLLEGQATFGGITAGVSAKLPPIVRPTPPESNCVIEGERCDVVLQLGQVEVGLADFEQSFGVSAQAGARVKIDGTKISLVIQEKPELRVWETSPEHGILTPIAVRDLIANVVWPELFGAIGDNLSITLPLPDLATLGLDQLAPGLSNAQLELLMRARPDVSAGYIGLGADLELDTPPPP